MFDPSALGLPSFRWGLKYSGIIMFIFHYGRTTTLVAIISHTDYEISLSQQGELTGGTAVIRVVIRFGCLVNTS